MHHKHLAILFFTGALSVSADSFYLTDAEGNQHGPFEFMQGEKVSITDQTFTISKVLAPKQRIMEKMKSIILPKIEFRDANIRDVVDYLQETSVQYDKQSDVFRGVSSVLRFGADAPAPGPASADPYAPTAADDATAGVPLITLSARNISLFDAMNIICKMCNLYWFVQDSVVTIESVLKK